MDENFNFGTLPEMMLSLGDPDCDWDEETRLVAAGHVLTAWQDHPEVSGLYETLRHAFGSTDPRTVYDLGPDDVYEICRDLWIGVEAGRLADPRHPSTQPNVVAILTGVDEMDAERVERFNEIAGRLNQRILAADFAEPIEGMDPEQSLMAKPDLYVLGFSMCADAAKFLGSIHPGDAQTMQEAREVFLRLFDLSIDIEENRFDDGQ